mmetsp:Transcript_27051/g.23837  ORF Transcript_27051/g.23837 Transcript_27051/m.23837 type:complete len:259 (-) Transcript_27051:327-1103(-)
MTALIEDDINDVENQQFLSLSEYRGSSESQQQQKEKDNKIESMDHNNNTNNDNNLMTSSSSSVSHSHPQAAFFTIFFKGIAIGTYIFGSWFSSNFILMFVFVILCLAFDFWTVKNVTGRLLVGLRWWNHVKDDGTSEWKFESKNITSINDNDKSQNKDSRLFWTSLYLTPSIWILLCISCIVKFNIKWLPLTLVGIALNGAQLWGYWKCRREAAIKNTPNTDNNNNGLSNYIPSLFQQNIQNAIGNQIGNQIANQFQN